MRVCVACCPQGVVYKDVRVCAGESRRTAMGPTDSFLPSTEQSQLKRAWDTWYGIGGGLHLDLGPCIRDNVFPAGVKKVWWLR